MDGNPLAQPSALDYQWPPFGDLQSEHFEPAIEAGMVEHLAEITAIATNEATPTFENTVVAMERSGRLLYRSSTAFYGLVGAHTNDVLKAAQSALAPRSAAHRDAILLNGPLYARVAALYKARQTLKLDAESLRLLERYHTDFVRAGAALSADKKEQLAALNQELSTLTTTFQQNVQADSNDLALVVDDKAELAGMSDDAIASAAAAAKARDLEGKWVLTLVSPTPQPALAALQNRETRKRLFVAAVAKGRRGNAWDNTGLIRQIVRLRAQRAVLLGYTSHAAYVLEDTTAKSPKAVRDILERVAPAAVRNAKAEAADMQKIIDAEGGGFELAPWDWAFYAEKVRKARYDFDASQMRPYLAMDNVLKDGLFYMAERLYGLTFKERKDLPVYHPDVRVFEVFEEGDKPLGLFLFDPFARKSKRGGAWMRSYVVPSALLGTQPVVANHLNVPRPPDGTPALLTFTEVTTAFHEFGHAIHGLVSNVTYPRFAGTAVPRDFVEFPSQVHEMWATWPEVLARYARHHKTGEPMPAAMVEKFLATRAFNQGHDTTEYLASSLLDMAWHELTPDQIPEDVMAFERQALEAAGVALKTVHPRYHSPYFQHVFAGGYSAGYYSYLWSEVLDADTVDWFESNGGLTRANGDRFRNKLLSRGGSVDAMQLYRDFRGQDPVIEPLLKRKNLTE